MIMDKKITSLYDDYRQGRINRRDFLRKLAIVAGSSAAAMSLLPSLEKNSLDPSLSGQNDQDVKTEFIKYPGETGE